MDRQVVTRCQSNPFTMIKLLPAGLPLGITIAGMIIGWYFPQWREIEVFLLFFITPPLLLLFIVLRNPRQRWLPLLFCLLVFSAVRISLRLNPDLPQDHLAHYIHQGRVLLEGVLYRQPEVNEEFTRIYIQSRWVRLPGEKTRVQGRIGAQGRVRVQGRAEMIINSSRPDLHIGDILLMEARLKAPRNYGNPGEYNRAAQSFLKKIYVKGSINEGHFFRIGVEKGYRVQRWLQGLRARLDRFLQAEKVCAGLQGCYCCVNIFRRGVAFRGKDYAGPALQVKAKLKVCPVKVLYLDSQGTVPEVYCKGFAVCSYFYNAFCVFCQPVPFPNAVNRLAIEL